MRMSPQRQALLSKLVGNMFEPAETLAPTANGIFTLLPSGQQFSRAFIRRAETAGLVEDGRVTPEGTAFWLEWLADKNGVAHLG